MVQCRGGTGVRVQGWDRGEGSGGGTGVRVQGWDRGEGSGVGQVYG